MWHVNLMNLVAESVFNRYTSSLPSVTWTNYCLKFIRASCSHLTYWNSSNSLAHSDVHSLWYQINIISVRWLNKSVLTGKDSLTQLLKVPILQPPPRSLLWSFSSTFSAYLMNVHFLFRTLTTFCLVQYLIGINELLRGTSHVLFSAIPATFHKAWHIQMFIEGMTR